MPSSPERLYDVYVLDLDGTIYLGEELLPGAKRLVLALRELDRRVVFLTNNPTKDPRMYAEKLTGLGLETPPEEVINTVATMTQWLLQNHPDATVKLAKDHPRSPAPCLRGEPVLYRILAPPAGTSHGFCYDPGRSRPRRTPLDTVSAEVSEAWPSPKSPRTARGSPPSPRTS